MRLNGKWPRFKFCNFWLLEKWLNWPKKSWCYINIQDNLAIYTLLEAEWITKCHVMLLLFFTIHIFLYGRSNSSLGSSGCFSHAFSETCPRQVKVSHDEIPHSF